MIIYHVELELDVQLHDEYITWLRGHLVEMLALPGFIDAEILERREPPPAAGRRVLAVQYRLRDVAAWDGYLTRHVARMRAAGLARFGERVHASRRLYESA